MPVGANSSPLIYLAALSDFSFLRDLFSTIVIPSAVYHEVVEQGGVFPVKRRVEAALGDWIRVESVREQGFRLKDSDYRLVLAKMGEL